MKSVLLALSIFLAFTTASAQNKFDSLVFSRNTEKLEGRVPTFYTPGYRIKAEAFKNAFEKAIRFYEGSYPVKFDLRLTVLDSAQWLREICPYGYLNYDSGWAMVPAQMSYDGLLKLYGIESKREKLDAILREKHITSGDLVNSVFLVYSLHELGHYFIMDLQHAEVPDMFANELIATYFSLNYFKNAGGNDLSNLLLFSKFISESYAPKFHKIADMDSLYTNMSVQNFKWYHCQIVLLSNSIYSQKKNGFIRYYLESLSKRNKLATNEVISVLDKGTGNLVGEWAKNLEAVGNDHSGR